MWQKIFTTVKYTLVFINFLFLITGIIILAVGSSVQRAYNVYHEFLSERFFSLPAFCIATGIIIFLIALAGFYGAFMESYQMNMAFAGAMILVFVFQLSACIAGYALKGNTVVLIHDQLRSTMELYGVNKSLEVTTMWDKVQRDFDCCGVDNASDWLVPLGTTATTGVPMSCCRQVPGTVNTATCNTTVAVNLGCGPAFGAWARSHAGSIGAAGVFVVLVQALAVGGAVWIAKKSREDTYIP
ncbi:CD63 antigen-like [Pectinophora gossypiella]|uniref:Tetraspanin n=2 Tax=Pectinophora gossypiella TaxID=13191 RepID=A0A1E1WEA3_PECGO|nr:CD63 antigen-like [Pectinophora gossypiella]